MFWKKQTHEYLLVLPGDENPDHVIDLAVGDTIRLTNDGDAEPFCIVKNLGHGKTRIHFRSGDEYITKADLELMRENLFPANVWERVS